MKPVLLLDIDGVILLHQSSGPSCMKTMHGWIDRDVAERLYELDGLFEIVWCTGWESMANDVISPMFGMGKLPVVPLVDHFDGAAIPRYLDADDVDFHASCWKLAGVKRWLGESEHPVAWLDDQIHQTDVKRWAQARGNTKLVQTRAERGLTEREMRMLVEFAREHRPDFKQGGGLRGRLGV
jgi:hypothetical protein